MDETIKALVDKLDSLEMQKTGIERDIAAIKRALSMIGVSPENRLGESPRLERRYANDRPFYNKPLADACLQILVDHAGERLSRKSVEYLLERGGYESSAKDMSNSVDITLRNLADSGRCVVERHKGVTGNRYTALKAGERNVVKDSRTTK